MSFRLPAHLLLGILAGWLNRHQPVVIEYLKSENEILKRQLNGRRLKLTNGERWLLAVKGKALGRRALGAVAGLTTAMPIMPSFEFWDITGLVRRSPPHALDERAHFPPQTFDDFGLLFVCDPRLDRR